MRKRLLAAIIALSGCAPNVTPCGLRLQGEAWLSVEDLNAAESMTLQRIGPLVEGDACAALDGFTVTALPPGTWEASTQEGLVDVDGLANCATRQIEVADPLGPWQFSSLAHELAHAMTRCDGHRGWTERGITQALVNVYFTAVPDIR